MSHQSSVSSDQSKSRKVIWQEATCQQCLFWIRPDGQPNGQCRRRPPTPSAIPIGRQEQGGIVIGGQEHKQVEVQVQVITNYPTCAPQNPACGDFTPAADFDKTVAVAKGVAEKLLPV